jgi:hypothetical protein
VWRNFLFYTHLCGDVSTFYKSHYPSKSQELTALGGLDADQDYGLITNLLSSLRKYVS